jgi:homoserine O-succinyltransferase/O-acetyltransferase
MLNEPLKIRVAVLDLYNGQANEGMRCIREILNQFADASQLDLEWHEFDVRQYKEIPDLSYDIYISSGGPGSPLDSEGTEWENAYFDWIRSVEQFNENAANPNKKHVFFICHSFQLAVRFFKVAEVSKRKSTAFGVFPVHMLPNGFNEPVFNGLPDPFYAVDSRDYQVTDADESRLAQAGGAVLCIEKDRPHVPLERAIMGIRFNEFMIGTQFHP